MKKIITGKAQTRATRERLERFPGFPAAILSGSDLSVSPLGFGSYRVHINIEEHRKALAHALRNGVNLIDTSANYTDGGSEMLIGSVLRELTESGELRREEVVIISKAGYIQGQNLSRLQQRRPGGDAFPEIIHYQQGLDHCIHPDFLEEQLTLSLERLQCDTIDYFLLHNPEYFLFDARRRGIPPQEARKTYYERIDRAFMYLEQEVQRGRIQYYGVSSNTLPVMPTHYAYTDLDKLIELARSLGKKHHFRMIQFPMNLLETGATDHLLSVHSDKIATVSNRPLNAYHRNQLVRLVSLESLETDPEPELTLRLKQLVEHEKNYPERVAAFIKADPDKQKHLAGLFATGYYLASHYRELSSYWNWLEQQARFLADSISYGVQEINELKDVPPGVSQWLDGYVELFNKVLDQLTLYLGYNSSRLNERIAGLAQQMLPRHLNGELLQDLALSSLLATREIDVTLMGMRHTAYVDDAVRLMRREHPPLSLNKWRKWAQALKSF